MAVSMPDPDHIAGNNLRWPPLDARALDRVVLDYDPEIDTLYVFLTDSPAPAVQIPVSDGYTYVGVRLLPNDSPTDEAVSVMAEAFRRRALAIHRDWQDLAELVPVTPGARPAPTEPPIERRTILSHFAAEVAAMGVVQLRPPSDLSRLIHVEPYPGTASFPRELAPREPELGIPYNGA